MRTQVFEAVLQAERKTSELPSRAVLLIQGQRIPASLQYCEPFPEEKPGRIFCLISMLRPLDLKWKDDFDVCGAEKLEPVGRGKVLNPFPPKKARKETEAAFLIALAGSEKSMLAGLTREKGGKGLREKEIQEFSSLNKERLLRLSQKLEEEGKVKILSFSPLLLVSQESFDFLRDRILAYVDEYHKKNPGQKGAPLERIKKRFGVPDAVLTLAVKSLERAGKIRELGQNLILPSHEAALSPEEEKILNELERMCFEGKLQSLSLAEVQERFRLSAERLQRLLALLIERRKIFQGPDGLYVHSHWLDEVIGKVRALGKKELTVADFKALTGLSRKYAIPLLELLDQMGVTRRTGATREIL